MNWKHAIPLTILFAATGAGPATLDLTVSRMDDAGDWIALGDDGSGRLLVEPCWRIQWTVSVEVPDDGIPDEGGLAGVYFDLVTDLRDVAPSFSLEPAVDATPNDPFVHRIDLDAVHPSFRHFVSPGTVIDIDTATPAVATLQGVGATQDVIDLVPPTPSTNNGAVVAEIAEGGLVVVARGAFSVPNLAPDTIFKLYTGNVPGNPGQTNVAQLEGPSVPGQFDDRWPLAQNLSPTHVHDESNAVEFKIDDTPPDPPALVNICDGIGLTLPGGVTDLTTFISPIAFTTANNEFDWLPLRLSQVVTLSATQPPTPLTSTGCCVPTVQSLTFDSRTGNHVLQFDDGVETYHWTTIELTVENACGQSRDVCFFAAHLPCDNNGDGSVGLADASAFVVEFNGQARLLLADIDDGGSVGLADVSAWVNNFNGNAGIGIPVANGTFLPPKPACP